MITKFPRTATFVEHWLVDDPLATRIVSHQDKGYAKSNVTTHRGDLVGDTQDFLNNDRIFMALGPGNWLYEFSPDGVNWFNRLGNQPDGQPATLIGGPGMRVQIGMGRPQPDEAEVWGRCTLLAEVPVISPTLIDVNKLEGDVVDLKARIAAVEKQLTKV